MTNRLTDEAISLARKLDASEDILAQIARIAHGKDSGADSTAPALLRGENLEGITHIFKEPDLAAPPECPELFLQVPSALTAQAITRLEEAGINGLSKTRFRGAYEPTLSGITISLTANPDLIEKVTRFLGAGGRKGARY